MSEVREVFARSQGNGFRSSERGLRSYTDHFGHARLARVDADLGQARGLPGAAYTDPAIWDLEHRTIFRRQWFAVGFASDIPTPGDFMPIRTAGWEILAIRGHDGVVRAFHNVCRHRGTRLVHEKGHRNQIRCGWHCWTYGLDGELRSTPIVGGVGVHEADGIDRQALGLVPLATEVWTDVIFVRVAAEGQPLREQLAPLIERMAPYALDKFCLDAPAENEERVVNINWKLYHEGGLEGYHIPFVHPALEQPPGYTMDVGEKCFVSLTGSLGNYRRLGVQINGTPKFDFNDAAQAAADRGERLPYTIAFTPPTIVVAPWPEMLIMTLLRPISVDKTGVRRRMYFIGPSASDPACQSARQAILDTWDDITNEDGKYSGAVQELASLRDEIGLDTRFSPYWEPAVRAFQQQILRRTMIEGE
ncbi:MAG: aromatic ring-hydroxylating dioxygenase subunit alpha [Alphaproteobacteria bacterium]|nr:aromatic ring-hydroxylating dioxygenase subunit alpha [Alphaproteobacteria bacterium]